MITHNLPNEIEAFLGRLIAFELYQDAPGHADRLDVHRSHREVDARQPKGLPLFCFQSKKKHIEVENVEKHFKN